VRFQFYYSVWTVCLQYAVGSADEIVVGSEGKRVSGAKLEMPKNCSGGVRFQNSYSCSVRCNPIIV
jgi:hypothetical protein